MDVAAQAMSGAMSGDSRRGGFAGVRLGFRFSTELQTAARKTQPKCSQLNRDGTSAPLDE